MSTAVETAGRAPTAWSIDPAHSQRRVLRPPPDDHDRQGTVRRVKGTVVLDEADPAASRPTSRSRVASIDTREAQRDAHLRSADFFDAERFPTPDVSAAPGVDGVIADGFKLVGDLTIHGVTREVALDGHRPKAGQATPGAANRPVSPRRPRRSSGATSA